MPTDTPPSQPNGQGQNIQVNLDFTKHWCRKHLKPYKAKWPAGAPTAMIELWGAFTHDPAVIEWCGGDLTDDDPSAKADPDKLPAALNHFAPICCHVGDGVMKKIKEKALG